VASQNGKEKLPVSGLELVIFSKPQLSLIAAGSWYGLQDTTVTTHHSDTVQPCPQPLSVLLKNILAYIRSSNILKEMLHFNTSVWTGLSVGNESHCRLGGNVIYSYPNQAHTISVASQIINVGSLGGGPSKVCSAIIRPC